MTRKELLDHKFMIDKNYREQMNIAEISQLETELEFYQRSHAVATAILGMHENEYINQLQQGQSSVQQPIHILFVGKDLFQIFPSKSLILFSTCANIRNMYTKIMWR